MTETEQLLADTENQIDQSDIDLAEDELALLKDRAKLMGIRFSNNIRLEALREKVNAAQAGEKVTKVEDEPSAPSAKVNPLAAVGPAAEAPAVKQLTLRQWMVQEQMKLVWFVFRIWIQRRKIFPVKCCVLPMNFWALSRSTFLTVKPVTRATMCRTVSSLNWSPVDSRTSVPTRTR